jgi:hypothetical protein
MYYISMRTLTMIHRTIMTLIGTSTNLVAQELLDDRYRDDSAKNSVEIGLFDLGQYGVHELHQWPNRQGSENLAEEAIHPIG